jgi:hypothetical protein
LRVLQASALFKWIDSGADDEKTTNASSVTMHVCMCVCKEWPIPTWLYQITQSSSQKPG